MAMERVTLCARCHKPIPAGRMVCPRCDRNACGHVWDFRGFAYERDGKKYFRYKCLRGYAPPLFRKAEAAAAPRWEPKVPRGLVAPARSAVARLLTRSAAGAGERCAGNVPPASGG